MNKKLLSVLSLVTLITLGGCGNNSSSSSNANSNGTSSSAQTSNNVSSEIDYNDGKYRVKVVYENGNAAPQGINVQWCSAGLCHDATTDANGMATIELEAGDYDVKLNDLPSGYAYQLGLVATADNRTMVITIYKVQDVTVGEGTTYEPYIVGEGVYSTTIEEEGGIVYYGFIPTLGSAVIK